MKMNWKMMAAAGMAALLGALTACGQGESGGESSRQVTVFEDFTAQDLDGNPVDESIFADCDVTMINPWAPRCSRPRPARTTPQSPS